MLDGTIDGYASYEESVAAHDPTPLPERLAGTDMLYSSGTTGRPKGVSVQFAAGPLETTDTSVTLLLQLLFGFTADDVYLSPAPMYHAAPLRFVMSANAFGCTTVLMDRFDRRGVPRAHRAISSDRGPGRADDVRPPAQAAGRGPRSVRRLVAALRRSTLRRRVPCR